MAESIVPIFEIHKVRQRKEVSGGKCRGGLWNFAGNTVLLIAFQRPTGVTRHLSRLPADIDVIVVAFDEETRQQLAIYERREWCEEKESVWREFLRDGAKVRYLRAKMGRVVDNGAKP